MVNEKEIRTYSVENCVAFRKTNEAFGGYPIWLLDSRLKLGEPKF